MQQKSLDNLLVSYKYIEFLAAKANEFNYE